MAAIPSAPLVRPRLVWIDLYRGAAVLVMIETHVANTFLAAALKAEGWFHALTYLNGLVAPAFLFIAGFAQGLSRRRARARSRSLRPRILRLAGIAALGFALHWPWAELAARDWRGAWIVGTRVDILPCLAAAMLVIVLLEKAADGLTSVVLSMLTAAIVALAPLAEPWMGGPIAARAWINASTGSLFPLLPWAAFAFAGYLASSFRPSGWSIAALALTSAAAAHLLDRSHLSAVSPAFFCERLAWILALVPSWEFLQSRWAPGWITAAGRESLSMYCVHLLLISTLAACGLQALGLGGAALVLAGVLPLTYAAALGWRRWRHPPAPAAA